MAMLTLTDEQVMELLEQLPPNRRAEILARLAKEAAALREENLDEGERRMRQIAAQRGMDWERMSDDQRLALADDLVHEDRECGR